MPDVYFSDAWGKLHEDIEGGEMRTFTIEDNGGVLSHMFILREIDLPGFDGYDITTPYGYGGPRIETVPGQTKDSLVEKFKNEFSQYCLDNRIVTEFVRFHPLFANATTFSSVYELNPSRETVGTSLRYDESALMTEFGKSCRKNIRKALNAGVSYLITEGPGDLKAFSEIYYDTMDRNKANEFYYFPETYFTSMARLFEKEVVTVQAVYQGEVIAMSLCLVSDGVIHIHLSGTRQEYLHLSPAYILRHGIAEWAEENGIHLIHHGGGRSNSPDDPLLNFKRQFGRHTRFEFITGKRVWDAHRYAEACRRAGVEPNGDFFPAYRSR